MKKLFTLASMAAFLLSVTGIASAQDGTAATQTKPATDTQGKKIGVVKFFNTTKGFGFISPEGGGKDVFVHMTAVQAAGYRGLSEGQKVAFDVEADKRGPKAVNIRLIGEKTSK